MMSHYFIKFGLTFFIEILFFFPGVSNQNTSDRTQKYSSTSTGQLQTSTHHTLPESAQDNTIIIVTLSLSILALIGMIIFAIGYLAHQKSRKQKLSKLGPKGSLDFTDRKTYRRSMLSAKRTLHTPQLLPSSNPSRQTPTLNPTNTINKPLSKSSSWLATDKLSLNSASHRSLKSASHRSLKSASHRSLQSNKIMAKWSSLEGQAETWYTRHGYYLGSSAHGEDSAQQPSKRKLLLRYQTVRDDIMEEEPSDFQQPQPDNLPDIKLESSHMLLTHKEEIEQETNLGTD